MVGKGGEIMATFEVSAPDGTKYSVNAPSGATEQDAIAYVQREFYGTKKVDMPVPPKGFGQKADSAIGQIPRQLGLTARHGIEGTAGTLGIFSEPIRQGLNLIPGVNLPSAEAAGQSLSDLIGLPNPETQIERIAAEPTKLLAGSAGLMGASKIASKLPGMVGKVAGLLAANPAAQLQSATGAGLAGGYTKETGGGPLAQGVMSFAGGMLAPAAISAAKGIPGAAKSAVEWLAPGVTKSAIPEQVDIVLRNVLSSNGMKLENLSASVRNQLREDVSAAVKVDGNLSVDAVRRLVDYRLTGLTPTRATLSLDPAEISRQKNAAKFGINSADPKLQQLGQIENANNRALIGKLNEVGANTTDDAYSAGSRIIGSLADRNAQAKSAIDAAYANARDTSGRSAALDPHTFTNKANDLLDEAMLGGKLPADVRNVMNWIAAGEKPAGMHSTIPMPFTVDVAEQFKTRIGDLQRATNDRAEKMALGLVRKALDDTPLMSAERVNPGNLPSVLGTVPPSPSVLGRESIDAFNNARSMNRKWMDIVDRVPALQAVRDGIEPDKFVKDFIIGTGTKASVMDAAKIKAVIKDYPDAMQAVRGQIALTLKKAALNNASDEIGSFSQSAYNKALQNIGERKLRLFFNKEEIDMMKALGRVASYEQVQPRGSAVNNSNTAGAGLAMVFDKLASSPLISKIPLGPQITGNISASLSARKAMNVPKSLVQKPVMPGYYPYLLPGIAAAGLLSGE